MIYIDITPMVVNRTAMYHIVRDTVVGFIDRKIQITLYVLNDEVDIDDFIINDFSIPHDVLQIALNKINRILDGTIVPDTSESDTYPRKLSRRDIILFDPLYLLAYSRFFRVLLYVLDITPITRPEWHREIVSKRYSEAYSRIYDKRITLLAISQSTANDLWANFGIRSENVKVNHLYYRFNKKTNISRHPKKQFLFVGSLEARKNVLGVIAAFEKSSLVEKGYELKIIGGLGHDSNLVIDLMSNTRGVNYMGRASDEQLFSAYGESLALIFPSFWEGFGLPALEAFLCGTKVILSETGALREILGDFAIYVDPLNIDAITRALLSLADEYRDNKYYEIPKSDLSGIENRFSFENYFNNLLYICREVFGPLGIMSNNQSTAKRYITRSVFEFINKKRTGLANRNCTASWAKEFGDVDSFSLSYLYVIQQYNRVKFSQKIAEFYSLNGLRFIFNVPSIFKAYINLKITSKFVRSLIIEAALDRIKTKEGRGDE